MNKKIIIADDDTAILEAIKIILEESGYIVRTSTGPETLEMINEDKPDVLLLDLQMSGVDGRDIFKDLRKNRKTKKIPVILISANPETEKIAKELGADDYLGKPFQMEDLLDKVARYSRH